MPQLNNDPLFNAVSPAPGAGVTPPPVGVPGATTDPVQPAVSAPAGGDLFPASADNAITELPSPADAGPGVTPEQTVQGQLDTILGKDSKLFDWAKGQASQYANSRGLQNSDIAAEASSQAVLGVAMPIAQQDAATFAARGTQETAFGFNTALTAQQGTIQSNLQAEAAAQQLVELAQQGDINSRLQLEQFGYNFDLSAQDNLSRMQQLALQGDINATQALQNFGFDTALMEDDFGFRLQLSDAALRNALELSAQDNEQWLQRIDETHNNTLDQIAAQGEEQREYLDATGDLSIEEFSRNLQQNYLRAAENRQLQFSAEVQSIYSQEGLTAAQQANAVRVARNNYENDLLMLQSYYASSPYWDTSWSSSSVPTAGAGGDSSGGADDFGGTGDLDISGGAGQSEIPPLLPDVDLR